MAGTEARAFHVAGICSLGFLEIVCCVLAMWHRQWIRTRFFFFFFVLDLMSGKKKKQLEARCQPLILTCKTSEEKRPCRTRSNDVSDMSIRGLCECPELAHGPLVNISNSTCNKTNGLASCRTCISVWNKLSTNWQKLSDSSIRALRRSLLWKDAETSTLAWYAFTHLCSSQGSTYVDQATKARIKLWLWNVGGIERAQQKKKRKEKEEGGKDGATHLLRHLSKTFLELRWKI